MAQPPGRETRASCSRAKSSRHPETCAHPPHHVVRRGGVHDVARGQMQRVAEITVAVAVRALAVERGIDAVIAQDADEQAHIGEVGHVLQRDRIRRKHACDHQRQGRVLRAADRDRALEALPPRYANSVHLVRRFEWLSLNSESPKVPL